jgi:hypothetical protein
MKPLIFFSLLANLFICSCCRPDKIELKGIIPIDTAKHLVHNFDERSFKREDRLGFADTRCVWFPIKQLEKLVQKIKCEKGDGVRFYLAAYNVNSMPGAEYDNLYRDHTTLIMVSTFDSVDHPTPGSTRHRHFDYFGKNKNGIDVGAILTTDPENRGEMCPPPNICAEEGALLFQP